MSFFLLLSAHISFSVIMFSSSSSDDDSTVSAPRDGNRAPVRGRLPFPRLPTRTRDAAGKFVPLGVQYPDMEIPDCVYEWSSVQDYMAEIVEMHDHLVTKRSRLVAEKLKLKAKISDYERRIRRLETDPINWERQNFDSIMQIPDVFREWMRRGEKASEVNRRRAKADLLARATPSDAPRDIPVVCPAEPRRSPMLSRRKRRDSPDATGAGPSTAGAKRADKRPMDGPAL